MEYNAIRFEVGFLTGFLSGFTKKIPLGFLVIYPVSKPLLDIISMAAACQSLGHLTPKHQVARVDHRTRHFEGLNQ